MSGAADSAIVLASSSPRRRQLLEMLRLPHRIMVPDVDETRHEGEPPEQYVIRLAHAKARAVVGSVPGEIVLAADTTVVLDGDVFAKPEDAADAVRMLRRLQGRTHQVMTAVAVARDDRLEHALDVSAVTFRSATPEMLTDYVSTGEPLDKAGAYAIQGLGALLIERVEGDLFGVMGLPLRLAIDLLGRFGRPYRFTR